MSGGFGSSDQVTRRITDLERKSRVRDGRYTVATVPDAATNVGVMIYVSNGAAGLPIMAFSDGSNWLRCDTRAAISP